MIYNLFVIGLECWSLLRLSLQVPTVLKQKQSAEEKR